MRLIQPGALIAVLALAAPMLAQEKKDFGADRELSGTSLIAGKTMDQWIQDLHNGNPSVRETALHVLPQYGIAARRAIPEIAVELRDPDVSVRVNAAIAVGVIGLDDKDVRKTVSMLKQIIQQDREASARLQAIMAIARIGADAKDATSRVAYALTADLSAWEIRKAAALALGNIALDPKRGPDMIALRALSFAALSDVDKEVKLQSLMSLVKLGPPVYDREDNTATKEAVNCKRQVEGRLRGVVSNSEPIIRIWGHMALMRMDKVSEKELKPIAKLLTHADLMTRVQAAQALGTIGPEAKPVVPDLIKALSDKEPMMRHWVALALGSVKSRPNDTIPALVTALGDKETAVRGAAAHALGVMGGDTKNAEPGLVSGVRDQMVPALTDALKKEKEPDVGGELMWALGEIGEPAKPAIPALERVVKEEEERLQKVAKDAIDKINGAKKTRKTRTP